MDETAKSYCPGEDGEKVVSCSLAEYETCRIAEQRAQHCRVLHTSTMNQDWVGSYGFCLVVSSMALVRKSVDDNGHSMMVMHLHERQLLRVRCGDSYDCRDGVDDETRSMAVVEESQACQDQYLNQCQRCIRRATTQEKTDRTQTPSLIHRSHLGHPPRARRDRFGLRSHRHRRP
jgi:hypothetical protein